VKRLLVLYPATDRSAAPRIREAAARMAGVEGVVAVHASTDVESLAQQSGRFGPVVELDFRDVRSLGEALGSNAWAELAAAGTGDAPALHAYGLRTLALRNVGRHGEETTDVEVAEGESVEEQPAEPLSTLIELPTLRRSEPDEDQPASTT
jgi:hypothetical protein